MLLLLLVTGHNAQAVTTLQCVNCAAGEQADVDTRAFEQVLCASATLLQHAVLMTCGT